MTFDRPESDSGETLNTDAPTGDPASLSEMFEILSRRPERRILFNLLHEERAVSVESLAGAVAATDSSPVVDREQRSDSETVGS